MDSRLQELCDRAEILDCLQRYARGIDRLDRELVRLTTTSDSSVPSTISSIGHSPTMRRRPGISTT